MPATCAADNFTRIVGQVLEKAKAIEESMRYDGGEGGEDDADAEEQELYTRCLPLEDIKALNVEAMRVGGWVGMCRCGRSAAYPAACVAEAWHRCLQIADAGMLKEVNLDDLVEVIGLMHSHMKVGAATVLQDDDDQSSDSYNIIMLSAEACLVILHLMTGDELPMEVFNEASLALSKLSCMPRGHA